MFAETVRKDDRSLASADRLSIRPIHPQSSRGTPEVAAGAGGISAVELWGQATKAVDGERRAFNDVLGVGK
jgi:hypothetical protein